MLPRLRYIIILENMVNVAKLTDFRSIGLLVYDMYKTITGHICPNINGLGAEIYFAGIAAVLVDRIALVQRDNGTLASADR